MKTFLRRFLTAAPLLTALLAGTAFATPTITITNPAAGSTISLIATPAGYNITGTASPTLGASITSIQLFDNGTSIATVGGTSFSVNWTPTTAGTHTITATVTDNSVPTTGTTPSVNTATATSIVNVTTVHTATVLSPLNNATIAQNSEIFLRASAGLSDAIIGRVEFFLDGSSTPLVTKTTAPFNMPMVLSAANNFSVGSHTLTAVATSSDNSTTATSAVVTFTVAAPVSGNSPPTVSITLPLPNSSVSVNSNVIVTATASDSDGFIPSSAGTGVTFFVDGDPITPATGESNPDLISPYSITWRPTVAKTYLLRAQTIDNSNNVVLSAPITVTATTVAPTITVNAPSTAVIGGNVTLSATASPGSGATITQVEFLVDGTVIGTDTTSPYSATWAATPIGVHSVAARLTDSNGTVVTSSSSTLNVTAVPGPTVSLTAPPTGTAGTALTINATATAGGSNTISSVQFFANGLSIGTDTAAPFNQSWTPSAAGSYSITAIATDSTNATGTSSPITINVSGAGSALGVTIAVTGSTAIPAGSTRVVTATVTGGAIIDRVELYLDNTTLVGTDTVAPYSFLFTAPTTPGNHFLSARVVDSSSLEATSVALPISVGNAVGAAPLVAIVAPSSGSFLGLNAATTISGTATDPDGAVTSVQVFVNGSTTGLANGGLATVSGSSWSIAWTPAALGNASITAIATDNNGNAIAAPAMGVNVTDASSPSMTLTVSPRTAAAAGSTTLPSGAVRNIVADATPSSGRAIVRVEFFVDGTKVGEDTSAPYTYRYVAPALGAEEQSHTYVLSARATDNAGAARDVQVPFLVVAPIGQPPTVNLLTPTTGASVAPNTAVSLAATAIGNGGSIASVQFYVNGSPTPVNSGNAIIAAPYTSTFTPTAPGVYTIDAIATDDRGNTTISNSATITAAFTTPTVTITSPNPNTTARATPNVPLNLTATATVQSGAGAAILLVEFLLDGVQIGARTTPTNATLGTYTFSWTPTTAQIGQHQLTARVTDTNSQTATSAPVNIVVATVVGTPPSISITQPAVGGGVGQTGNLQSLSTVNFVANAASSVGTISNVEFFLNDISIGLAARERTTNTYRLAFDLGKFDFSAAPSTTDPNTGAVRYTVPLYAIARDNNNNQTVTNPINLTVNTSTSLPPTVSVLATTQTTITQGQQFLILPNFNDPDGTVTQLQVFANGVAAGAAVLNPQPNLTTLSYTGNTAGSFNIYFVATDDTGNTAVLSPAIVVTVNAVAAPVTTITRPSDNSTTTTVGAPVFLEGTASSSDPTQIPTLSFIATSAGGGRTTIFGQRVGTSTTYRAIWNPTTPGTYSVTTQANIGTTAQSTSVESRRVVVSNLSGLPPTVSINGGVPNSAQTASTSNFTATATDPDGSVVEVEFFLNRNSIGKAQQDPGANTWRITASFAGVLPGSVEVVALARDSLGNVAASTTNTITVTAAQSIAPTITITPSTTNAAFNRQVQLRANARDTDGTISSVRYFANATDLGQTGNANTSYQVNWTPTQSGKFKVYAIATDNSGITTVSPAVEVTVRRNNPVLEDAAFILQTYSDIANTTNINPIVFDDLDAQLGAGTLSRADLVVSLIDETGFLPPVQLLAAYYVLMGQWPTPANYNSLIGTARGNLANAVGNILSSNEYFAKYGVVPTTALLNNPASAIPADTFITRLWQSAGLGGPTALQNTQFRSNNVLTATLGRGYNSIGLNQAIAEFITNTNSNNTALYSRARAAALYYQLDRPPVTVTVDQITARITTLTALNDPKAIADAVLTDILYNYRYVTITKHPESVVVTARSGVLFTVEAQGAPPLAYQWLLNGAPIAGATNSLLSLTNVDATRVGTYTAVVTSSAATATSDPATLALTNAPTRLANISTRGMTNGGANVLIGGFVITGTNAQQTRQVLIRVVGPTLANAPFNVTGVLANPRLEVYSGNNPNPVLTNDDWGTQAGGNAQVTAIQQAINRAGAFAFAGPNSADAAILATLPPGPYTVQAKGPANNPNASGVVLIEVYDVTPNAAAAGKAGNVSTRGNVGTGTNVLIAGFVVNGAASRRMLIRGAGPTLANLGVPGVLADPQLTLVEQSSGRTIKTNDDWASGDDAGIIAQAATAAGAFPFANGSKDAAMIVMLAPGAYTVQLSGVNNGTGVGIVEVYDVDP